ncbi:GNAT family N-acetyltransferase [Kribbella sp. NPDC000426]|uniref:GNAT family N-acetyltransferase n=1 Tax=Kribbella sp. NPDC000426 TaxID=3154255 RepID=UPI0033218158
MRVRRYEEADHSAVLALAPRLAEGVASWRSQELVLSAVTGWVVEALARATEPGRFVLVADDNGTLAGFAAGEERAHWSGDPELYVGELAVDPQYERRGVGRALIDAVSDHARQLGLKAITLDTGAANANARAFYRRLGFEEEDVKLTMRLDGMIGG